MSKLGRICVVATAVVFVGALIQVQAQCRKPISQEEAIEIADRTVTTAGFDLNDLDRTIAQDVEERKKHLKWSIDGQLGEEARQEAQQMDTALRKHTNVYAVIYQPKRKPGDREVLGGISVLLDAETGEVVFYQPAHRKATYPSGTTKTETDRCSQ